MNEPTNETPTAKIAPLSATAVKMPPYAQAAGALIDAAMQVATVRAFPMLPTADDFEAQKQAILRVAQTADALVHKLIEDAECNSPCHFPLCPQPMMSALNDSDVFSAFKEAASEAEFAHSKEAADADRGDRAFHDRGL